MSKELPQPQQSEEVDLGQLFKLIGNAFDRFFKFVGRVLNTLFLGFVWLVFFLKKQALKIIIAAIIGFGLGMTKETVSDPIYKSTAVVKQNYKTGENLYNLIDYYNKLIGEGDLASLSSSLGLENEEQLESIIGFEVESVATKNDELARFDKYKKSLDSVLAATITFEDYIESAKTSENPLQRIILKAKSKNVFKDVIPNIIESINKTQYFVDEQKKDLDELTRQEDAINEALSKSEALQGVYQEVLKQQVGTDASSQTTIRIDNTEDKSVTKEFELYTNDVRLRRELVEIQRKKEDKSKIIELISSQENTGTVDTSSRLLGFDINKKIKYAILLGLLTFVLLLTREFVRFLDRFKDKI